METMRLCMVVYEIVTVLGPVMSKHAGTNGSKLNNAGVLMLNKLVVGDTQGH